MTYSHASSAEISAWRGTAEAQDGITVVMVELAGARSWLGQRRAAVPANALG
jgi:hypothetical protein